MSPNFESSAFVNSLYEKSGGSIRLSNKDANNLQLFSSCDARKLLYFSLMTLSEAIVGIEKERYSWSIVKLYYSAFYSIRSILYENGVIISYVNGKPVQIRCIAGSTLESTPRKIGGSTHKWAFHTFATTFPSSPLISQEIEGKIPFDWIMKQREVANYNRAIGYEPSCPPVFEKIHKNKIRTHISTYLRDTSFGFDPDHAMIAYPLFLIEYAVKNFRTSCQSVLSNSEASELDRFLVDKMGKIPALVELRKRIST